MDKLQKFLEWSLNLFWTKKLALSPRAFSSSSLSRLISAWRAVMLPVASSFTTAWNIIRVSIHALTTLTQNNLITYGTVPQDEIKHNTLFLIIFALLAKFRVDNVSPKHLLQRKKRPQLNCCWRLNPDKNPFTHVKQLSRRNQSADIYRKPFYYHLY